MRRERDRELERRLAELPMNGEAEAEERSWEVVRAAYADRTPVRPTYRARRFALAAAVGAVLLAIGLSPAGAQVGDWVRDVVGEEDAKPELKTLPAAGEILVEGGDGVWIVHDDGSKRRLGDYEEATWSPHGRYVAATDGNRLVAVDPAGEVQWEIQAPAEVHDPRWAGTQFDTRIAYRSGGDLWVVAGDGTDAHVVSESVAPIAPVWRPLGDTKLGPPGAIHVLTFLDRNGQLVRTVDADTGRRVPALTGESRSLPEPGTPSDGDAFTRSPLGDRAAVVRVANSKSELFVGGQGRGQQQLVFSGPGRLTEPAWSPDGRWILIGWRDANQWLFINADDPTRVKPFDNITEQFDGGAGEFPRVAGWVLPAR